MQIQIPQDSYWNSMHSSEVRGEVFWEKREERDSVVTTHNVICVCVCVCVQPSTVCSVVCNKKDQNEARAGNTRLPKHSQKSKGSVQARNWSGAPSLLDVCSTSSFFPLSSLFLSYHIRNTGGTAHYVPLPVPVGPSSV